MPSPVIEIDCVVPVADEDAVGGCLINLPVLGTSLENAGPGLTVARIYVDGSDPGVLAELEMRLAAIGAEVSSPVRCPDGDWLAAYRAVAKPFEVGRLWWVDPQPADPTPPPRGRIRMALEPRRAFGSGSHESTQLMLQLLEGHPPTGRSVLDVGTGSLVLALASERLGARRVVAFDLDLTAALIAGQVRSSQEWDSRVLLFAGSMGSLADVSFDLVLCNMQSGLIAPMLGDLAARVSSGGHAMFSGVLASESAEFTARLSACGLKILDRPVLGEWTGWRVSRG